MQQQISTEKYVEITNFKNKAGGIFSFVSYPMSIEVTLHTPPPDQVLLFRRETQKNSKLNL